VSRRRAARPPDSRARGLPSAAVGPGPTMVSTSASSVSRWAWDARFKTTSKREAKTSSSRAADSRFHCTPPRSAPLTDKAVGSARGPAASGAARYGRARAARSRTLARSASWAGLVAGAARSRRSSSRTTLTSAKTAAPRRASLDDHGIAPLAPSLAVPPVDADDAKSTGLVQPGLAVFSGKMRETSFQNPRAA